MTWTRTKPEPVVVDETPVLFDQWDLVALLDGVEVYRMASSPIRYRDRATQVKVCALETRCANAIAAGFRGDGFEVIVTFVAASVRVS